MSEKNEKDVGVSTKDASSVTDQTGQANNTEVTAPKAAPKAAPKTVAKVPVVTAPKTSVDGVSVAETKAALDVMPVIGTEGKVPTAKVETVEKVPLAAPTAIVPSLVFEQTTAATDGTADAPTIDVASKNSQRVRIIGEGSLGLKMLKKDDITDDEEYVALLDTERGRLLVEAVK